VETLELSSCLHFIIRLLCCKKYKARRWSRHRINRLWRYS